MIMSLSRCARTASTARESASNVKQMSKRIALSKGHNKAVVENYLMTGLILLSIQR